MNNSSLLAPWPWGQWAIGANGWLVGMVGWDRSHGANGAIGAIPWGQWGQWWLDLSYGAIGAYRPHGGHRIVHGPWGLPYHHPTYQPGQHRPMGSYRWQADRDRSHRYP